jgi:hypothetical protein
LNECSADRRYAGRPLLSPAAYEGRLEVELKMPKLRQTFEMAIIERYRRRDISIE